MVNQQIAEAKIVRRYLEANSLVSVFGAVQEIQELTHWSWDRVDMAVKAVLTETAISWHGMCLYSRRDN